LPSNRASTDSLAKAIPNAIPLGLKDIRLALAAADAASVPLPVANMVRDSLLDAIAHHEGAMDLAVLGKVAARRGVASAERP
jgi:3-hydroxyisobutyrate dehydrogenase-like beta-hydroxyacid dehydrogenase